MVCVCVWRVGVYERERDIAALRWKECAVRRRLQLPPFHGFKGSAGDGLAWAGAACLAAALHTSELPEGKVSLVPADNQLFKWVEPEIGSNWFHPSVTSGGRGCLVVAISVPGTF